METVKRTAIKSISWQLIGFVVLSGISYLHTGSLSDATSLAGTSMVSGLVLYFCHEQIWQRVKWGKVV